MFLNERLQSGSVGDLKGKPGMRTLSAFHQRIGVYSSHTPGGTVTWSQSKAAGMMMHCGTYSHSPPSFPAISVQACSLWLAFPKFCPYLWIDWGRGDAAPLGINWQINIRTA